MIRQQQHYVWKHYVSAWEGSNGLVECLREGRVFSVNPRNIMVRRFFYRLSTATQADVKVLDAIVQLWHPTLHKMHRDFINTMVRIANANEIIQRLDVPKEDKEHARSLVIEVEEQLQSAIEAKALPILRDLQQQSSAFLSVDDDAMAFYHYLAHQYFRTKRMREVMGHVLDDLIPGQGLGRLRNLFCYCIANNLGGDLYVDRRSLEVVFFAVSGRVGELITGDQPVVNLLSTGGNEPPEELILYYPVSPRVGVLLAPRRFGLQSRAIGRVEARVLNRFIAWKASEFLVAKSRTALMGFRSGLPRTRPPIDEILDRE